LFSVDGYIMALMPGIGIWQSIPFLCGGFHSICSQTYLRYSQIVSNVLSQAVQLLLTTDHEIFFARGGGGGGGDFEAVGGTAYIS